MVNQPNTKVMIIPIHPYIPNSDPVTKEEMLKTIGVKNVEELFAAIPHQIRLERRLDLPNGMSELEVWKHVRSLLGKNRTPRDVLSFLGAGCWPHYVPAACDEIGTRSEFLTAYTGDVYSDLGRYQALFEFQSMMGDLTGMDTVTFPVYDWSIACADASRMALKVTGRRDILVPKTMSPDMLAIVRAHTSSLANIRTVDYEVGVGCMDVEDLRRKISSETAAVYIENPSYLGFIETEGDIIGEIAHDYGALLIAGVEPLSLGVLTPPGEYGADIVCGEGQPLGMHMNYGGALLGFIACKDEERFLEATGHRIITLTRTEREGEWGFGYILPERTMFSARENAATYTGTATVLWAITAAVYMALLGPQGLRELAERIMQNCYYAMKGVSEIMGVDAPVFDAPHFKEFTVRFDRTGHSVRHINEALLTHRVQGGKDLSAEFPELGNSALYCVTEVHSQDDIERLVAKLEEVVK